MTEQHDPVDDWLERDVRPLMPPAGQLERIRHKARRRKRAQALTAAAGCAVVVAAVATVPQFTSALHGTPTASRAISPVASAPPSLSPRPSGSGTKSPESTHATLITPPRSHLTSGSQGNPVPKHFRPTSVTFAPTGNGVVGAVIGQAGPPCATQYCTSLAQTPDYGAHWYGLSAPLTGPPQGSSGVSQLRFVSLHDGWAFGPDLEETTGGGWPWSKESTHGARVTDLEAAGQSAFAIFASCSGTTADYASDCTSFSLYTSVAGTTSWTPVAVPYPFLVMKTSAPSSASLVISGGTTAYLLTPSGEVISGPVSGGSWSLQGKAPCSPGPALANGAPADAQLAAGQSLMLACHSGQQATIYSSPDGKSWHQIAVLPTVGAATSLGGNSTGQFVLATTSGIYYSADSGKHWQAASVAGAPAQGFSYVGMTNATQGVAIPADANLGEIFVTSDGGHTWTASAVKSVKSQ